MSKRHGDTGSRLYRIWKGMRTRATNKNRKQAKDYVLRGIFVIHAWFDVCYGCASRFELDHLYYWDDEKNCMFRTSIGEEYEKIEEGLKRGYGLEGHELYEEIVKTPAGRKKINKIRDLLYEAAKAHFSSNFDDGWFDDRLDTDCTVQMKLAGIDS